MGKTVNILYFMYGFINKKTTLLFFLFFFSSVISYVDLFFLTKL